MPNLLCQTDSSQIICITARKKQTWKYSDIQISFIHVFFYLKLIQFSKKDYTHTPDALNLAQYIAHLCTIMYE